MLKNAAVAGLGIWAGDMVATAAMGMLPVGADGNVNPWLARGVRYGVAGLVVVFALKQFGARKG